MRGSRFGSRSSSRPGVAVLFLALSLPLALSAGCAGPASTRDTAPAEAPVRSSVPDGINDRFLDPELDPDAFVNRWEVESREIYSQREEIVAAIGLRSGDRVADVGAGTGLFVAPFSTAVGAQGRVYAIDISPRFIDHLRARVEDENLGNVTVVHSGETSVELASASVDVIYCCDTYHHFEYHEAMLASIRDALRPGGRLVIVDFERIPGVSRDWILGHVRAGKEQVISEIEAAGFRYDGETEVEGLEENYLVRFTRP